jgi:hypothetical protein
MKFADNLNELGNNFFARDQPSYHLGFSLVRYRAETPVGPARTSECRTVNL